MGIPIGTQPIRQKPGKHSRLLGSRIELGHALERGANFLCPAAWKAAKDRQSRPEKHQNFYVDRLYADLLSSMPMCFNLFGPLSGDLTLASAAVRTWWPEAQGSVGAVRFEWSPGRRIRGKYLENASAFDVAFELSLNGRRRGIIGVETKYHEHCKVEKVPSDTRLRRYRRVTSESGVFKTDALQALVGTHLQQIWLDHLLALSMVQDRDENWDWSKFILVYPERNPSFRKAAEEYLELLTDRSTFAACTIESILDAGALPPEITEAFRGRYLW